MSHGHPGEDKLQNKEDEMAHKRRGDERRIEDEVVEVDNRIEDRRRADRVGEPILPEQNNKEVTADELTEPDNACATMHAQSLDKLVEIPIRFNFDNVTYKLKRDLVESDITVEGMNKLHRLYLLLFMAIMPSSNLDIEHYIKENDLFSLLEEETK